MRTGRSGIGVFLAVLCASSVVAEDRLRTAKWDAPQVSTLVTSTPTVETRFVPVTPCRLVDTRNADGTYGGPPFAADEVRTYNIPMGGCGMPVAAAYSLNFTIVNYTGRGNLKAYPAGTTAPVSTISNFGSGLPVANAAIVPADAGGSIDVAVTGPTNIVIDVNGYFLGSRTKSMTTAASVSGATGSATLLTVTVPPDQVAGGRIAFTLFAADVTFRAAVHGDLVFVATSTTISCQVANPISAFTPLVGGTGISASCFYAMVNGQRALGVSDSISGFVPTSHELHYEIHADPTTSVTILP